LKHRPGKRGRTNELAYGPGRCPGAGIDRRNQVILNIIVNASHAIAESRSESDPLGTITISTPINVGSAYWEENYGNLRALIELQDVNYPGSKYTLDYLPDKDISVNIRQNNIELQTLKPFYITLLNIDMAA